MAIFYAGIAGTDGQGHFPANEVVFAISGGTMDDSNLVQVNWNDSTFGATAEGKQRLANAVKLLAQRIEQAKEWPVTTGT